MKKLNAEDPYKDIRLGGIRARSLNWWDEGDGGDDDDDSSQHPNAG
jgi:hypothetical protein